MPRKKLTEEQRMSITRFNAMKHGFAARSPIIPAVEDEADWKRHLKEMRKALAPEGYFEELLVRRLATALWEIDRLTAHQVSATMSRIKQSLDWMGASENFYKKPEEFTSPDPYELEERMQATLLPDRDDIEMIMRYGGQLHRQWIQVHNQLLGAQARRRGEKVPLGFFDVAAPPQNYGPRSLSSKGSASHPAAQLAKAVDARVTTVERAQKDRKRARPAVPDYLAKEA